MMENISVLNDTYFRSDVVDEKWLTSEKVSHGMTSLNPAIVNMIAEGGISIFSYLNKLGLAKEPDLMVLSSKHHYYYDENDLKNIKILVNLKKLNLIKHPNAFLDILNRILPPDANFIGCFTDSKSLKINGSRLLNRFINILDSKTDRNLDRNEVTELLASHGFRIIDMTEIEDVTYFFAKPVEKKAELRA